MNSDSKPASKFWLKQISLRWAIPVILLLSLITLYLRQSVPVVYVSRAELKTARNESLGILEIKEFHLFDIKAERAGIVKEANLETGQHISRGEKLVTLDMEEMDLRVERTNIEKKFLEDSMELPMPIDEAIIKMEDEVEIYRQRFAKGQVTPDFLEDAEKDLEQMYNARESALLRRKLDLETSENTIKKQAYSLDRMEIKSPIDGVVVDVFVRKGDLLYQGATAATVIDQRLLVVGLLSEDDFDKVQEGYPVELSLNAFPDTIFKGKVDQILPMSDPETRKFEIYIDADIPKEKLIPGLTGEIVVIADERKNAVVVPSQAVFEGHVLKVEGNKIRKVPVETGFVTLMEIEILSGLEAGDIVVTESNNLFEDGQLVRTIWE